MRRCGVSSCYPKGSEWRKWDLHFHTPSSYDYKNKSVDNSRIIEVLKANGISAVVVTDHLTIDIKRILELKKLAGDEIAIFPGIELCSNSRGSEPIHFIGIFPENSDLDYIWGQLYNGADIASQEKSGRKNNEIYCKLDETCTLIRKLGGLVSIHTGKKSNSLENITNALPVNMAEKLDISRNVDIFEIGKESDVNDYHQHVFPNIKKTFPMVLCSDNHDIEEYTLKQNCWIKADLTFEGLKQILYEPTERVAVQEFQPDEKDVYRVISEVTINDKNFSSTPILLNSNLTVIIGSRSSGKTTLLNSIAKTIDINEFNSRFNGQKLLRDPPASIVKWKDGSCLPDSNINKGVTYIPQNYIISLAEAKDEESPILEIAEKAIFDSQNPISLQKEQLDSQIEILGTNLASDIFRLFTLKKQISEQKEKIKKIGDKAGISEQIKLLNETIKLLQKNFTPEDRIKLAEISKLFNENKNKIENLSNDIGVFTGEISQPPLETEIFQDRTLLLKSTDLIEELSKFEKESKTKYLTNYLAFLKTKNEQLTTEKTTLETINTKILSDNKDLIDKSRENKSAIEKIKEKEQQEAKLAEIIKEEGVLGNLETFFSGIKDKIIEAHKQRADLKNGFIVNTAGDIDGVKYSASVETNKAKLNKYLEDSINIHNSTDCRSSLNAIPGYKNDDVYDSTALIKVNNITTVLNLLLDEKLKTKSGIDVQRAVEGLFSDFEFINYSLSYEDDEYPDMTPGKKALVVLKLLIESSKDKYPILIDQPEDDLDSRSISNEIVNFLRTKKKERQIILVTHNANIAIKADAEEIIVVNRNGPQAKNTNDIMFEYSTGSIENTFTEPKATYFLDKMGIREHACDLLEGGKEAFENRRNKFNIKNL